MRRTPLELLLGLVDPRHVLERHLLLLTREQLGLGLAKRESLVPPALHLPHEEDPEADEEDERRPRHEHVRPGRTLVRLDGHGDLPGEEAIDELLVAGRGVGAEGLLVLEMATDLVARNGDVLDVPGFDLGHEIGELHGVLLLLDLDELPRQENDHEQGQPQHHGLESLIHALFLDLPPATPERANSLSYDGPAVRAMAPRNGRPR
jgi:hypothetical protein